MLGRHVHLSVVGGDHERRAPGQPLQENGGEMVHLGYGSMPLRGAHAVQVAALVDAWVISVDQGTAGSPVGNLQDLLRKHLDVGCTDEAPAPECRAGQAAAGELGPTHDVGAYASRARPVELGRQRLPPQRVRIVVPQDVVEHPIGAGHPRKKPTTPCAPGAAPVPSVASDVGVVLGKPAVSTGAPSARAVERRGGAPRDRQQMVPEPVQQQDHDRTDVVQSQAQGRAGRGHRARREC